MVRKPGINIAIVGATGAVGKMIMKILDKENFPINKMTLLSSKRSAGKKVIYQNKEIVVKEAVPKCFSDIDIAFFCAGGSVTNKLAKEAVSRGAIVIDNTSAFRMDDKVPLVVPEVNSAELQNHQGIIANPNCSTIQMVVTLKPIQKLFGLSRIVVSTYQAVSGAGLEATKELLNQTKQYLNNEDMSAHYLPVGSGDKHIPIAFNALPQIDVFEDNGYTAEEMKMINESKKILQDPNLSIAATCVRLPIINSHAESLFIKVKEKGVTVEDIQQALKQAEGVILQDDPKSQTYPTPLQSANKNDVFVGRIRKDLDDEKGFHLWIVSDNLIKGAALNTVQIAQSLIKIKS